MYLTGWFKIIASVDGENGESAFVVDVDDEMIPVAVINDGKAYGQKQVVTVSAFYGSQPVPVSDLEISVVCSNESRFTATRNENKVTITVVQGSGWKDIKKETVEITVKCKYGERKAVISLFPTFPGKDSCIYSLYTSRSSLAFARNADGAPIGKETVEIKIRQHIGTTTKFIDYNPTDTKFQLYDTFDEKTYGQIANSKGLVDVYARDAINYRYLIVELWSGYRNVGTLLDIESIPLLIDGKDGEQGKPGPPGEDGTSVNILGSYNSVDELLKAHPTGNVGEAYLVNGVLYVWNKEAWVPVGKIQGPAGETAYIHLAYANSADGRKDFSTTDSTGRSYVGTFASNEADVGTQWRSEYKWMFVKGEPGDDGNSVVEVINFYKKSINGDYPPAKDASWLMKAPPLDSTYRYLWNFERTIYSKSESKETEPVVKAYYSEDGRGIKSIIEEFGLSHYETVQPTSWRTTIPKMDAYNKYLWNRETIKYTTGADQIIDAHIIGVYGDKGEPGSPGNPGANGKDAPIPNPNLLHATSFKAIGLHDDKWNTRITTQGKSLYPQDVDYGYAEFDDLEGGLFNTKYLYAFVFDGVEPTYVNLVQQCIIHDAQNRKVRKSSWYTLSFWSKGAIVVYVYSTEKSSERVVERVAYVDGVYRELGIDAHVAFNDDSFGEWQKHTITFKTTNIDYTSHILFRMFTTPESYPSEDPLEVSLCCIKLEEGKEATPWCRSERDIRGARAEQKIWQEGRYYFQGEDGEDAFSIVEFGVEENGDPQYYFCKKTLDVPSKLGVNDPVTSIQKHLGIWDYAPKDELGLFGRIAAHRIDTKSLVTHRFYSISEDGSRSVKIENGIQEFFGTGPHSNIRLGLDENGCAMLEFYDKDGVFQYGLGPSQLGTTKNRQERWDVVKLHYYGTDMSEVIRKGQWKVQSLSGKNYYEYTSAIITNVNQDPRNDGRTFTNQSKNSSKLNGIYAMAGPCMLAYKDLNGNYELPNKHPDNNPTKAGEMYMRALITYFDGKIVGRQPVYWSSYELGFDITVPPLVPDLQ